MLKNFPWNLHCIFSKNVDLTEKLQILSFSPHIRKSNTTRWSLRKFCNTVFWKISVKTTYLVKSFTVRLISRNNSQVIQKFRKLHTVLTQRNFWRKIVREERGFSQFYDFALLKIGILWNQSAKIYNIVVQRIAMISKKSWLYGIFIKKKWKIIKVSKLLSLHRGGGDFKERKNTYSNLISWKNYLKNLN